MRAKLKIVSILLCAALLSVLGIFAYCAQRYGYQNLLLAVPKMKTDQGLPIERIEELNEEKFMLSYENISEMSIKTDHSQYSVMVKGTNFTYPYMLKYPILSGGFFTKDAQDYISKVVVMNEKASFDIFGGMDVTGNTISLMQNSYLVVGVIDDGDRDNRNLYVLAECLSQTANTFILAMNNALLISEEHVMNELKIAGITESRYDFYNLDYIMRSIYEKFIIALGLLLCCVCYLAFRRGLAAFSYRLMEIKILLKDYYLNKLLINNTKEILAFVSSCILTALGIGIFLFLAQYMFKIILVWENKLSFLQNFGSESFVTKLEPLQSYALYSNIVLVGYIAILALFIALIHENAARQK